MGFVVLALFDANLASPVAGFAAVKIKAADIVFLRAGSDVRADHETVTFVVVDAKYTPIGVF